MKVIVILMLLFSSGLAADQLTAMKSGCLGCHQADKKTIGPSIAELQELLESSDLNSLVARLQKGRAVGELKWGNIPMPPNLSPAEDILKALEWMKSQ